MEAGSISQPDNLLLYQNATGSTVQESHQFVWPRAAAWQHGSTVQEGESLCDFLILIAVKNSWRQGLHISHATRQQSSGIWAQRRQSFLVACSHGYQQPGCTHTHQYSRFHGQSKTSANDTTAGLPFNQNLPSSTLRINLWQACPLSSRSGESIASSDFDGCAFDHARLSPVACCCFCHFHRLS